MKVTVKCDRCGKMIDGIRTETATAGFYAVGPTGEPWGNYANSGEIIVCDTCMWKDPRYLKDYSHMKSSKET